MKKNKKIKGWKILRAYIEVIIKLKAFSYNQKKRIPEDVTALDKKNVHMKQNKDPEISTISVRKVVTNTVNINKIKTIRKVRSNTPSALTHKKKVKSST